MVPYDQGAKIYFQLLYTAFEDTHNNFELLHKTVSGRHSDECVNGKILFYNYIDCVLWQFGKACCRAGDVLKQQPYLLFRKIAGSVDKTINFNNRCTHVPVVENKDVSCIGKLGDLLVK